MSAAASISASDACQQGEGGIAVRPQCLVAFRRGVGGCRGYGGREIASATRSLPLPKSRATRDCTAASSARACSRRGLLLVAAGLGDLGGDAAGLGMVADQQRTTPSDAPVSHFGTILSGKGQGQGQGQGRSAGNRPGRHPPILSLAGNPAASRPLVSEVTRVPFRYRHERGYRSADSAGGAIPVANRRSRGRWSRRWTGCNARCRGPAAADDGSEYLSGPPCAQDCSGARRLVRSRLAVTSMGAARDILFHDFRPAIPAPTTAPRAVTQSGADRCRHPIRSMLPYPLPALRSSCQPMTAACRCRRTCRRQGVDDAAAMEPLWLRLAPTRKL